MQEDTIMASVCRLRVVFLQGEVIRLPRLQVVVKTNSGGDGVLNWLKLARDALLLTLT